MLRFEYFLRISEHSNLDICHLKVNPTVLTVNIWNEFLIITSRDENYVTHIVIVWVVGDISFDSKRPVYVELVFTQLQKKDDEDKQGI